MPKLGPKAFEQCAGFLRISGGSDPLDNTGVHPESYPLAKALLEEAGNTIILDCKEMNYISSSGLRVFLTLRKAAAMKGGKVIIRNINDNIRNVFMMTGFLNLFDIE